MIRVKDPKVSLPFYQDVSFVSFQLSPRLHLNLESLGRYLGWIFSRVCSHLWGPSSGLQTRCDASTSEIRIDEFGCTLYLLAFNHEGRELTAEEKEAAQFSRQGMCV